MTRKARTNVRLEAGAGCLFLLLVAFLGLFQLLGVNWVGTEFLMVMPPQGLAERLVLTPRGFLTVLSSILIPPIVLGLGILGIRWLLVEPEPPPWVFEEPEDLFWGDTP